MKFLVTGGTGYIASACIKKLLSLGYEVIATTRNWEQSKRINQFWLEQSIDCQRLVWQKLDLMHLDGWQEVLQDVDVVLHMASPVPQALGANFSDLVVPAVTGVRNIMNLVAGSRVKKIVMTSSIAAMRNGVVGQLQFDHNSWTDLSNQKISAYAFSKTYAEMTAWNMKLLQENMPELVTILPGFVVGEPAYPIAASASVVVLKRIMESRFIMPFCLHPVALNDVVDVHIEASLRPGLNNVRLPCCVKDAITFIELYHWLHRQGLVAKKYCINLPKVLIPNKYSVYLDDQVKLDADVTSKILGCDFSSIEAAVVAMASFLKKHKYVN